MWRKKAVWAAPTDEQEPTANPRADHGPGLVGAAVRAPLSQGRDGSLPLELDGDDLAEPHVPEEARGEPIEPVLHAPTTTHIEPRPVATGECTVETMERVPLCEGE
jgi:hypothetical protein